MIWTKKSKIEMDSKYLTFSNPPTNQEISNCRYLLTVFIEKMHFQLRVAITAFIVLVTTIFIEMVIVLSEVEITILFGNAGLLCLLFIFIGVLYGYADKNIQFSMVALRSYTFINNNEYVLVRDMLACPYVKKYVLHVTSLDRNLLRHEFDFLKKRYERFLLSDENAIEQSYVFIRGVKKKA